MILINPKSQNLILQVRLLLHSAYNKNITLKMIDLFQDRRIFINHKRKNFHKNGLPQIKYPPGFARRINDDYIFKPDIQVAYNYQPLSNILISKKICPPNPQQNSSSPFKKKVNVNSPFNFSVKKQSVKRIVQLDDKKQEEHQIQERSNGTSLSYRIKLRDKFLQEISLQQSKSRIRFDECTFAIVKANNNQDLVRQILLDRKIWKQVKLGEQVPNLKWLFSKEKYNYKKMWSFTQKRMVNHFQFNQQICTKDNLIRNLQIFCETKKIQMFSITPITFIIDFDDQYCEYHLKQFMSFFTKNDPRKGNKKNNNLNLINKFLPYMAWQNSDIKKKINILSRPVNNSSYYSQASYLWLLKPTGLNRGRGIQIFDSLQMLQKILMDFLLQMNRKKFTQKFKEGKEPAKDKDTIKDKKQSKDMKQKIILDSDEKNIKKQCDTEPISMESPVSRQKFKLNSCSFVVQKYVERPFLIQNRKFDIRVWAMLTDKLHLYFFKEGYIRTSAEAYSTDDISNYFIHLTNNAIQKNSENYGQFQNGNQLSFWELKRYMPEQKVQETWTKIKQITYMAFSSVKKKINYYQRKNCFELFGLDYFIDVEGKVWLIEVNENPCIECSSPLLGQLIPRMISDCFKLTLDQMIDKKAQQKVYHVENYSDSENMWQNIGQLTPNGEYSPKKKNKLEQSSNI